MRALRFDWIPNLGVVAKKESYSVIFTLWVLVEARSRAESFENISGVKSLENGKFFEKNNNNFVIKIHAKKSRRFDLSDAIFKCE